MMILKKKKKCFLLWLMDMKLKPYKYLFVHTFQSFHLKFQFP